ncbi:type II toxin-antitoxin system Phd/YefM family antitoxin [Streptomyces somaliensis DSM 40738]|uniref:Antitoxin n=1 Tax=Streptomyces somaliensis (strain ATCC 33201 / DSM 40738 / JCM 12659 / KCTC 9044 / NCTC 11332 / NRRL B-12077 / IP 733) TaxID=1134445 RepID=A0AA44DCH6_STRE0|nr:type II toxin-antitoxin system Phd/YefM family antitoxin [Streptomyces somaliensis DSM 40738]
MLGLGARARPGAVVREVGATREPVAVTDRGRTVAVLVDPAHGPRPGRRSAVPACSASSSAATAWCTRSAAAGCASA